MTGRCEVVLFSRATLRNRQDQPPDRICPGGCCRNAALQLPCDAILRLRRNGAYRSKRRTTCHYPILDKHLKPPDLHNLRHGHSVCCCESSETSPRCHFLRRIPGQYEVWSRHKATGSPGAGNQTVATRFAAAALPRKTGPTPSVAGNNGRPLDNRVQQSTPESRETAAFCDKAGVKVQ